MFVKDQMSLGPIDLDPCFGKNLLQISHCHLPTMLHVLWFVHANGQFDPEVVVRTAFRHRHLVELRLLGTVGSRVEHNLGTVTSLYWMCSIYNMYCTLYKGCTN